jgi:hypothetical protein
MDGYTITTTENTVLTGGVAIAYTVVALVIAVLLIIAEWKIFTKAGKPGWHSLIPFLNLYDLFEIAGMNGWMFLLLLVPCVGWIAFYVALFKLCQQFGKGTGFGIGMILFPNLFMLILGFGSAQYVGTKAQ